MNLLNDIMSFFATHEAALAIMSAWASREWQHAWPELKSAYPWLKQEGGVRGVLRNVFYGSSATVKPIEIQQPNIAVQR